MRFLEQQFTFYLCYLIFIYVMELILLRKKLNTAASVQSYLLHLRHSFYRIWVSSHVSRGVTSIALKASSLVYLFAMSVTHLSVARERKAEIWIFVYIFFKPRPICIGFQIRLKQIALRALVHAPTVAAKLKGTHSDFPPRISSCLRSENAALASSGKNVRTPDIVRFGVSVWLFRKYKCVRAEPFNAINCVQMKNCGIYWITCGESRC